VVREPRYTSYTKLHLQLPSIDTIIIIIIIIIIISVVGAGARLCGLVVRVLGYRSGGPGSIPGTTR
jgi:hypothetical protein